MGEFDDDDDSASAEDMIKVFVRRVGALGGFRERVWGEFLWEMKSGGGGGGR